MMNPLSTPVMQRVLAKKQSGDKQINWVTGLFMGLFHWRHSFSSRGAL
jgi:hypothetical protein